MRIFTFPALVLCTLLIACAPQQANLTSSGANASSSLTQSSIDIVTDMAESGASLVAKNGPEKVKALAMEAVRGNLKDPASAQFRNVRLVEFSGGKVVCGEVNAKNAYGGYVGYTRWVSGGVYAQLYKEVEYEHLERDFNAGLMMACS